MAAVSKELTSQKSRHMHKLWYTVVYRLNQDSLVQLTCGNEGMFPGEGDTHTTAYSGVWRTIAVAKGKL